jgi:hypothetical protein
LRRSGINSDEIKIDRKKILQKIKKKEIIIIENSDENSFFDIEEMGEIN